MHHFAFLDNQLNTLMDIFIMTLEYQEISRLLAVAENKIERFEQKIQNISAAMEPLKVQREAVLAALEYASREETRRKLTDLFVKDGEYGLPINFSAELLSQIEQRKNELDQRIHSYEHKREERQKGIEFIRHDIELLKKIQHLELKASLYEAAALIDG
jgi:chromosome segregation ATPase